MNCFNHHDQPALGICKHCNKGICANCLTDLGDGIACTATCVEDVLTINQLIEHNKKIGKHAGGNYKSAGILYIVMGAVFSLGVFLITKKVDPITLILGAAFLVYGLYTLIRGQQIKK